MAQESEAERVIELLLGLPGASNRKSKFGKFAHSLAGKLRKRVQDAVLAMAWQNIGIAQFNARQHESACEALQRGEELFRAHAAALLDKSKSKKSRADADAAVRKADKCCVLAAQAHLSELTALVHSDVRAGYEALSKATQVLCGKVKAMRHVEEKTTARRLVAQYYVALGHTLVSVGQVDKALHKCFKNAIQLWASGHEADGDVPPLGKQDVLAIQLTGEMLGVMGFEIGHIAALKLMSDSTRAAAKLGDVYQQLGYNGRLAMPLFRKLREDIETPFDFAKEETRDHVFAMAQYARFIARSEGQFHQARPIMARLVSAITAASKKSRKPRDLALRCLCMELQADVELGAQLSASVAQSSQAENTDLSNLPDADDPSPQGLGLASIAALVLDALKARRQLLSLACSTVLSDKPVPDKLADQVKVAVSGATSLLDFSFASRWQFVSDMLASFVQLATVYELQGQPTMARYYLESGAAVAKRIRVPLLEARFWLSAASLAARLDKTDMRQQAIESAASALDQHMKVDPEDPQVNRMTPVAELVSPQADDPGVALLLALTRLHEGKLALDAEDGDTAAQLVKQAEMIMYALAAEATAEQVGKVKFEYRRGGDEEEDEEEEEEGEEWDEAKESDEDEEGEESEEEDGLMEPAEVVRLSWQQDRVGLTQVELALDAEDTEQAQAELEELEERSGALQEEGLANPTATVLTLLKQSEMILEESPEAHDEPWQRVQVSTSKKKASRKSVASSPAVKTVHAKLEAALEVALALGETSLISKAAEAFLAARCGVEDDMRAFAAVSQYGAAFDHSVENWRLKQQASMEQPKTKDAVSQREALSLIDGVERFQESVAKLPEHWTVCSLTFTPNRKHLVLTRVRASEAPITVRIPLPEADEHVWQQVAEPVSVSVKAAHTTPRVRSSTATKRRTRRGVAVFEDDSGGDSKAKRVGRSQSRVVKTVDGDSFAISDMSFAGVQREFSDIMQRAHVSTHSGGKAKTSTEIQEWWLGRLLLDRRLDMLMQHVQRNWFGLLAPLLCSAVQPELWKQAERAAGVLLKTMGVKSDKEQAQVVLTSALLSPVEEDETRQVRALLAWLAGWTRGLETGFAPFAGTRTQQSALTSWCAQFAELQEELLEVADGLDSTTPRGDAAPATILLLPTEVQHLPWEAMPILRGDERGHCSQSVSRAPSWEFVMQHAERGTTCDTSHGSFVLNPCGTLKKTQQRLEPLLSEIQGWTGLIGQAPQVDDYRNSLAKDVFLYSGHDGGEQFVRVQQLHDVAVRAVSILMGCSSGKQRLQGEFESTGTASKYLAAGCPAVVANLWDVTDEDIDKYSHVLVTDWVVENGGELAQAVQRARKSCKLRFLVGAAPVHYGVPVRARDS